MNKRPKGITAIVVLQIIATMVKISQYGCALYTNPELVPSKNILIASVGIPLQIIIAVGLFRGWKWCWIISIILFMRKVLGAFLGLFQGEELVINLMLVGILTIEVLIIWYLVKSRAVIAFFSSKTKNQNNTGIVEWE